MGKIYNTHSTKNNLRNKKYELTPIAYERLIKRLELISSNFLRLPIFQSHCLARDVCYSKRRVNMHEIYYYNYLKSL